MRANKEIAPGKDLIWTMLFCFVLGLIPIFFCFWVYWYWGDLQLKADDDFVPAFIYENNLAVIRILAFEVLPIMGFAFFCIGYMVWKCHRQRLVSFHRFSGNPASSPTPFRREPSKLETPRLWLETSGRAGTGFRKAETRPRSLDPLIRV